MHACAHVRYRRHVRYREPAKHIAPVTHPLRNTPHRGDLHAADPTRRNDSLLALEKGLTLVGPYELLQGGTGLLMRLPIFIDGVDANETFGAPGEVYECPAGMCYDATTRRKFW